MNKKEKKETYEKAKKHVTKTCDIIKHALVDTEKSTKEMADGFSNATSDDQLVLSNSIAQNKKRIGELKDLKSSPYFVRCDILREGEKENETWYFSKFNFSEENIYSWVTPASSIRFEAPGNFSYQKPNGEIQKGNLIRKDQYMIVDGKVIFLATESKNNPRELVHQEYFSQKKSEFELSEIVAQMEKAQDQVIRAHHEGPFMISGPAGSGKTTLALHRVAYLVQSPDTAQTYSSDSVLVLVQDLSTKEYFSHLLPKLGIKKVTIKTFSQWAMSILEIQDLKYCIRFGKTEKEKDSYEYKKLEIMRNLESEIPAHEKNPFSLLQKLYSKFFDDEQMKIFQSQKKEKKLDRFDLTILLLSHKKTFGEISTMEEYYEELKNGKFRKKKGRLPVKHSLIVVDEFQNYLPEQLQVLKSCVNQSHRSIVYVGEMAQKIQVGTIRDWTDINESVSDERVVTLKKVYRNTKNILKYIHSLGYEIEIPDQAKTGKDVVEKIVKNKQEEVSYIKSVLKKLDKNATIGILAKEKEYLLDFEKEFENENKVRIFDIREAQGVEFDTVFLVGIGSNTFSLDYEDSGLSVSHQLEKRKIQKNLLYLALTRAISELHIVGNEKLKNI
jgi:DNA helicase IV